MHDDLNEFGETMRASDSRGNLILKIALVTLICVTALFLVHLALDYEIDNGLREDTETGIDGLPEWLTEEDYYQLTGTPPTNNQNPTVDDQDNTDNPDFDFEFPDSDTDTDDVDSGTDDTDSAADDTATAPDETDSAQDSFAEILPTQQQMEEANAAGLNGWGFYYQQLTPEEQEVYRAVCAAFDQGQYTEISFPAALSDEQFDRMHYALKYDHPEYFWVGESTVYYSDGSRNSINRYSEKNVTDDIPQVQMQLRAAADEILAALPAGADEYEKSKYLYEQIIERTDYIKPSPDDQNIKSVLINHASVCTGYARTYQYLATLCGLRVTTVCGTADESHAWSLQMIGDTPYWTDVTYGDPLNDDGTPGSQLLYDYLCVPDRLVSKHVIQSEPAFAYPSCTDGNLFYYAQSGVLLDPFTPEAAVEAVAAEAERNADALAAGGQIETHFLFNYRQDYDQMMMELADRNSAFNTQIAEKLYEYPVFLSGYHYEYQGQEESMHITDIFRTQ